MKLSKGAVSAFKLIFIWGSFSLLIFFMSKSHELSPQLLLRAFVNMGCVIALFQMAGYLSLKYLSKNKYLDWSLGFLAITLGTSIFRTWFELLKIGTPIFDWTTFIKEEEIEFYKMVFFFFLVSLFPFFLGSFYYARKRNSELESNLLKLELKQMEAELGMLKNQLSPHFLFNTLNNIYSSTLLQKKQAPEMILKLSDLFRYVIYTIREKKVSLESEVDQIKNYISLFQYRFPEKLNISMQIEGNLNHMLPPMLLLPYVENAVKHSNLDGENSEAFLFISLLAGPDNLVYTVKNSYEPRQAIIYEGGIGNTNIKNRLILEYPEKHQLFINKTESIYEVILEIDMMS